MSLFNWMRRRLKAAAVPVLSVYHWAHQRSRPILKHARTWFWLFARLVLIAAIAIAILILINCWNWLSTVFWNWLRTGPDGMESGSTTVRNFGLVIAGLVALPLAIWRSRVAQHQADTAQQSLLNERYQQGAEMLGNEILTVRLGGIYALQRLTEEHPEQYHLQVMRLFCTFVRHPVREKEPQVREDVDAVMMAIGARQMRQLELEWHANLKLDLHFADLSAMTLPGANLSNAQLWDVDLSQAGLDDSGSVRCTPLGCEPVPRGLGRRESVWSRVFCGRW